MKIEPSAIVIIIIQCILPTLSCGIAITELKKSFRSRTEVEKKEANQKHRYFILLTFFSILLVIVQFFDNAYDKQFLNSNIDSLKIKNDSLINVLKQNNLALSKKIMSSRDTLLSDAAIKSLQTSQKLISSSKKVVSTILGGKDEIFFSCTESFNKDNYIMTLVNATKFNQYDVSARIIYYQDLKGCKIFTEKNKKYIDKNCIDKYLIPYDLSYLSSNDAVQIPDLTLKRDSSKISKYYIYFKTRSISYLQEYYMSPMGDASRLFQIDPIKKRKIIYKTINLKKLQIDWSKEFSMIPYIYQMKPYQP